MRVADGHPRPRAHAMRPGHKASGGTLIAGLLVTSALVTSGAFYLSSPTSARAQSGAAIEGDGRLRPYVIDNPVSASRRPARAIEQRPVEADAADPDERPSAAAPVPAPMPVARQASPARRAAAGCANPNALGVSREVEIDATGGPRFGFQQYKTNDLLREGEIVLTFDDGPAPAYTKPILQALENHCTKATFFIVGRNALAYPEIVRDEHARGHTIANHTWSHANLGMRKIVPKRSQQASADVSGAAAQPGMSLSGPPLTTSSVGNRSGDPFAPQGGAPAAPAKPTFVPAMSPDKAKAEIELGFSATSRSLGVPMAPFFRFPYLGNSTAMHNYLSERNVAIFSIDVDSVDYRAKKAEDVINRVMSDLKDQKKGILLFHDIQPSTAQALPTLLDMLQARGYRVVHLKPKAGLQTIASYDARVGKDGVRQDAIAEKKPLVKRTMTWGMAPAAPTASVTAAKPNDAYRPPVAARKPVMRAEAPGRAEVPGYIPPGPGQAEVLPWLTNSRRTNNGW